MRTVQGSLESTVQCKIKKQFNGYTAKIGQMAQFTGLRKLSEVITTFGYMTRWKMVMKITG